MRIKRFTAPDMRTALRMIRDEQGPDAVILSNRAVPGGIEVVAATDYDESLVSQALSAATPAPETLASPTIIPMARPASVATSAAPAPRENLAAWARATFKIGDSPTAAELTAASNGPGTNSRPAAALASAEPDSHHDVAVVIAEPTANHFEAMMAALASEHEPAAAVANKAIVNAVADGQFNEAPVEFFATAASARTDPRPRAVTATAETDPTILAMREDMASMRKMIERQMEQLSLERLRGSPARTAVYDALIGYGCEDALAQAVAGKIDPRMDPSQIHAPMFAELARMVTVAQSEPVDEGGVIALVGPTGAGKTTTAAKLAARYAARHCARDVALITTDGERAGAHEQLHAYGRRLGISVCQATGPQGLQDALAQLTNYPLVLIDTTGYAPRDRALFAQILWLRAERKVRSLLVLPANAHPHDLDVVIRRYTPAAPEGVVLTKIDETGRLGSALSVTVRHGLSLAYTSNGQQVPSDIETADADRLANALEKLGSAADNTCATEDRHATV